MSETELTHLLKLADDDSEIVRSALKSRLLEIDDLEAGLDHLEQDSPGEEMEALRMLASEIWGDRMERRWNAWRRSIEMLEEPFTDLEVGLGILSEYLSQRSAAVERLRQQLDALADEFLREGYVSARELAAFLFEQDRFSGNRDGYYATKNSDMLWLLEHRKGNPIGLCCIFILVGRRLGLRIDGCNYPGHFLARVEEDETVFLVDCYNRGTFYSSLEFSQKHPLAQDEIRQIIEVPATPEHILIRVLRNLENGLDRSGQKEESERCGVLWKKMLLSAE